MYPSLDCLWASGVSPVSLLKVLGEKSPYCYSALYPDRFLPGEIMCRNFFFFLKQIIMPRIKSWILFSHGGWVLFNKRSSGTCMVSMYCLLSHHLAPALTPHSLLHTSSSICLPSQMSQLARCTETPRLRWPPQP